MKIGIIDAEYFNNNIHFPNLCCMKLSSYYKQLGHNVYLINNKFDYTNYDNIYISKVFTNTILPFEIKSNMIIGGTGFYYDKSPSLPLDIEHIKPDYNLYDSNLKYFKDYMIAKYTLGCFRKCDFCVNKHYDKVVNHSEINEWADDTKNKVCLLDDNFLGYSNHIEKLVKLMEFNKPFQFKQGLDIRLLNKNNVELLTKAKYDGDYLFAFDNIKDKNIISEKLKLWRNKTNRNTKLYILTAFDRNNKYDYNFEYNDFIDLLERIKIIMQHQCLPYIMRYENYKHLKHYGMYVNIASWCNQPNFFKKKSLIEWIEMDHTRKNNKSATMRYFLNFKKDFPDLVNKYFYLKYEGNK